MENRGVSLLTCSDISDITVDNEKLLTMDCNEMSDLAKPGDPYIDGSGKTIEADDFSEKSDTDIVIRRREVLPKFSHFQPAKERKIDDLPEADQQQQTVIIAVIGLRMLGLDPVDIQDMLGASMGEIERIMNLPSTQATFEKMFKGMISVNADTVQGRIASYANNAVSVVVDMMNNAETRDDVRLKAAQDVLDRSGTNADQFFTSGDDSHSADDELRITIMDEEGGSEKVSVEIKRK